MRIAYVCHWDAYARDGVARKLTAQIEAWRAAGEEAELFCLTPQRAGEPVLGGRRFAYTSAPSRLAETARLAAAVRSHRPDVVYLRWDAFLPPVWLLARLLPTVVEVNADDAAEARLFRSPAARAYLRANRAVLARAAAGAVCVARELARFDGLPTLVLANGADPDAVAPLPAPENDRPLAVFLGTPLKAWHGVPRLLDLARALPELDFELIGVDPSQVAGAPPNVRSHGLLPPDEYRPLLARADVAIGSLAMHEAGLREGSPLKVREYLLAGIPTVIAYEDTDFPDEPWYLLRLPALPGAGDAEAVRDFVESVRGRRVPRDEAVERVGSPAKERERLAFLRQASSTAS